MSRVHGIRRLLHISRDRAGVERAVDDELRFHFDMTMRDLMNGGMTPDEARRETVRRFGDLERTRARLATIDRARVGKEQRAASWRAFAQDARYAVRGLRLTPGFTIAVIVTLGLGIGANATMFGIVDRLLFRPPNFLIAPDRATRLYLVETHRGTERPMSGFGYQRYMDLRTRTQSFDAMTPFSVIARPIGDGDATAEMKVAIAGADVWRMFDVHPVIGRFFTPAEDVPPDGVRVVVLSYGFWQTQFGGRRDVIGSGIDIGPAKFTVIGVAPEGFNAFSTVPVAGFVPFSADVATSGPHAPPEDPWYRTYHMTWFEVFARRKAGVTIKAATSDLTQAYQRSYAADAATNPGKTLATIAKPHAFAGPVLDDRGPNASQAAKVATWLVGVAAIVLLIACANVANLLLARALKRRREIALRIALGISRGRLLMQLMTESLLLAVLGGATGVAIAHWGGGIMRRVLLADTVQSSALTDTRVLLFSAAMALAVGLLTGFAPALHAGRTDVATALKAGSREGTVHRSRLRVGLLVVQAALSVVLLVGAGLFLRSLEKVQHLRLGYDADRLLWVNPKLRGVTLDSTREVALGVALLERAQHLPGVEHAARALTVPFWSTWQFDLFVAGIDSTSKLGDFTLQGGSADFFATMGSRILRGRGITAEDGANTPRVMVVTKSMADRLWPGQDAIGKCVRISRATMPCITVVGVAENVRRQSLSEPEHHYYLPIEQFRPDDGGIFVRTHGPASVATEAIRRGLQPVMPGASYVTVTPMSTIIEPRMRSWTLGATMFAVFGALALVLAAVGLYSVIAYNVTQRTHEMGVRVALGAESRDVIALIVREGLRVVVPGVALGAIIALVAGKWVAPLLFEVSPKDPPVMVTVVVALLVVAIAASWVPAVRASRVDPNEALRAD